MNSKDQRRNATVNDRLDAVVKSASDFAESTAERLDGLNHDVAYFRDFIKANAEDMAALATADTNLGELIRAEHDGRVHADDTTHRIVKAFLKRGFWSRMNWIFTGR